MSKAKQTEVKAVRDNEVKAVPEPDEDVTDEDVTAASGDGRLDDVCSDLGRCLSLIEALIDERDKANATIESLKGDVNIITTDREELKGRYAALQEELLNKNKEIEELKKQGQKVRDSADRIFIRLQQAKIAVPAAH